MPGRRPLDIRSSAHLPASAKPAHRSRPDRHGSSDDQRVAGGDCGRAVLGLLAVGDQVRAVHVVRLARVRILQQRGGRDLDDV
ncbi:hypothetical protein [Saccharopolyspora pogona]|uniref:hypothetical protein n=1 Tax=Saccharopolyspora pogona TaxID=333966 RepID=UPI0016878DAA|nr:hypothetical protein [Saccharopolyspora pogona]